MMYLTFNVMETRKPDVEFLVCVGLESVNKKLQAHSQNAPNVNKILVER